jgi:hypothetical protein
LGVAELPLFESADAAAEFLNDCGWETTREGEKWIILTPGSRYPMERGDDDLHSLARGVNKYREGRCLN